MPPRFDPRAEIARIRWEFAYIDIKLKRERLRLALRYDESQPRAPAGSPNGGQWVGTGGGASGRAPGESAPLAPQTTVQADGTRQELRQTSTADSSWLAVQDTYRPDGSLAAQTVYNRDNSIIESEFAPADGSASWDSRHTIYAPGGRILTVQNTGPVQTLFDTDGHAISQSIWRPDGPEPQDLAQPAFMPPWCSPRREPPPQKRRPLQRSNLGLSCSLGWRHASYVASNRSWRSMRESMNETNPRN